MKNWSDEILWSYLDQTLDLEIKDELEADLALNKELKSYVETLCKFDTSFSAMIHEAPSLRFSKSVIEKIEEQNAIKERLEQPVFSWKARLIMALSFMLIVSVALFTARGGTRTDVNESLWIEKASGLWDGFVSLLNFSSYSISISVILISCAVICLLFLVDLGLKKASIFNS